MHSVHSALQPVCSARAAFGSQRSVRRSAARFPTALRKKTARQRAGGPQRGAPEGDEGHPDGEAAGAKVARGAVAWKQRSRTRRRQNLAVRTLWLVRRTEAVEEPAAPGFPRARRHARGWAGRHGHVHGCWSLHVGAKLPPRAHAAHSRTRACTRGLRCCCCAATSRRWRECGSRRAGGGLFLLSPGLRGPYMGPIYGSYICHICYAISWWRHMRLRGYI
jgi:hypothetical protein